ncbi:MAG: glyoxalase [Candidatus Rokuibacteriota bacterium]|nr:MAG: glyoxalase [Candidatus Rokubacteria bacterium]
MLRGLGLRRLQHLVLYVADVERSTRFYLDVLGFEVQRRFPGAAFLKIPGTSDDHHLGLFEDPGIGRPSEGVARMYHAAWEVGDLADLARARERLISARSLVGQSDHGTSLSLYAKDPDGLEFELFWTVPDGKPIGTRALNLEAELARRGVSVT